jgi:hypothetical protein
MLSATKRLLVLAVVGLLATATVPAVRGARATDTGQPLTIAASSRTATAEATGRGLVNAAAAAPRIWEAQTSPLEQSTVQLAAAETITFETTGLSAGADPVLHLIDPNGREVAMDDDGAGGNAARLRHKATAGGAHHLIVRAGSPSTAGTASLVTTRASGESSRPVSFAAWQTITMAGLRAGEKLTTVRLPGATAAGNALLLIAVNGENIERRASGNGTAGGAELVVPSAAGTRRVVLATSGTGSERARLVRNDAALSGHDTDGDGLGTEVEAAANTCAARTDSVPGVSCASVADLRDTDGDGISDGPEVLGHRFVSPGRVEHLPLPRWGANPRHKDLFVEVDFMRRTEAENTDDVELKMTASVARRFAGFYGDVLTTDPATRVLHASMLANPDGKPGIAVHLDTGQAPQSAADATIFGDWGGYTAVDAIVVDGEYRGQRATVAWKTEMSPARRGIFRYALGYGTGGGQTGRGLTASYNFHSSFLAPHETGHSLGLGHGGPLGLEPDVNCKPNYPSLMNYAFDSGEVGFADGRSIDGPALNNWALKEHGVAAGSPPAFFDRLENVYGYHTDRVHGHVDWNRDGDFAPAGTTVRAYANQALGGGGCEYTRYNRTRIADASSTRAPALVRHDGRLYTFYTAGGEVRYTTSTSTWNCPAPVPTGCAGGTWTSPVPAGLPTLAAAVDAVEVGTASRPELLVVAVDAYGGLWQRRHEVTVDGGRWTGWTSLPGSAAPSGPTLLRDEDRSTYLVHVDPDGRYLLRKRTPAGAWTSPQPMRAADGTELSRPVGSHSQPALVEAKLGWKPGLMRLYALLAGADDRLDLWAYNPATLRWDKTDMLDTRPGPVAGRPGMAWVAPGPTSNAGKLYVLYSPRATRIARWMSSYVDVDGAARRERIGLDTYFDNVWRTTDGADLLYERGVDTNLRAAISLGNSELWFHPKADGIHNSVYTNQNDWLVLRRHLCSDVVNPDGLVPDPVVCAENP